MTKNSDISHLRKEYTPKFFLDKKNINSDPFLQFCIWFDEALKYEKEEVNAMVLSTVDENMQPDSRVVLLKHYKKNCFTFFTNLKSKKLQQLKTNSKASLLFFWKTLSRQIIIKGNSSLCENTLSDKYFHSRPRDSQIGAWASQQSSVINSRTILEDNFIKVRQKFYKKTVPRPDFWGGVTVKASSYEFWQGQPNRLHDRIMYTSIELDKYKITRLSP